MFKFRRCGFTLIEMMVVLAIIAIVALMALPNTQDKVIRTQIAEALPLADIAKEPIAKAWSTGKILLPDNASAGLPSTDKVVNNFVSNLMIVHGVIHITFGNRAHPLINGKILSLRPAVIDDAQVVPVTWVCGYAPAPEKMTIKGVNDTSVDSKFLPALCR